MAIQWNVDGMILVNIWCHQKWLEHPRITNWRLRLLKTSSIEMGELSSKTIEIMEVLMNHFQGSSKSLPPLDSDRNTRISRKICQSEFAWCILLYQPLFPISSVKRRNGSKRHFECLSERVLNYIQWFIIIIPVN